MLADFRLTPLGESAELEQLVQHPLDGAHADRQMAFVALEVSGRLRQPRCEPLAVGERNHQVGRALPHRQRRRDLVELEAPWPGGANERRAHTRSSPSQSAYFGETGAKRRLSGKTSRPPRPAGRRPDFGLFCSTVLVMRVLVAIF